MSGVGQTLRPVHSNGTAAGDVSEAASERCGQARPDPTGVAAKERSGNGGAGDAAEERADWHFLCKFGGLQQRRV